MRLLASLLVLFGCSAAFVAEPDQDGFVPLFNGKDLSGWEYVNTPTETFFAKDGMIVTTGRPTGYLRTGKQYENFIAEFDWMHIPQSPAPSATAASSSGLIRFRRSARHTRAASKSRCS